MKKINTTILLFFLFFVHQRTTAQDQIIQVTGIVHDKDLHEPLPGVTVLIKDSKIAEITNEKGEFQIKSKIRFPFTLVFTSVGFQPKEFEVVSLDNKISIELNTDNTLLSEVVISASRVQEKWLQSPVSIEKIDIKAIKESPAPTFYESLDNIKGVQLLTSSLTLKVPNSRGFNVPNNFRFMQLVDGVDVQAATLGVPLGNAIGPTELDIQSIEITPGAASALYGMNAINGLASLQTKSPFQYQGLSIYQRTGLNHIDGKEHDPSYLSEVALRYAKAFNNKLAFKVNASYLKGTDWISNNLTDQNPAYLKTANPNYEELSGEANPAADLWNNYGDERNNRVAVKATINGTQKTFNVSKTGYLEKELVTPEISNVKFDAGAYYKIKDNIELSYVYRYGLMDGTFQRGNKIRLEDATVQNHKLELKGKDFLIKAYSSIENIGKSYNLKPLADNLDLTHASNNDWKTVFQNALQTGINNGIPLAEAFENARTQADQGRAEPGTPEFEALKNTIIGINNWDHANGGVAGAPSTGGAWLKQKSTMYHFDSQYNLTQYVKYFDLLVGFDYRLYSVIPDGNNFVDFSRPIAERNSALPDGSFGENQKYEKYGGFAQATKKIFNDKLKINASLRIDRNPEFEAKLNPRIALVYSPAENHNFRISYQNGYRFPSLFEALSFVNNGNVRRVGGLPRVNEGIGFLENSYTLTSIDQFTAAVNAAVDAGIPQNQAALNNRNVLVVANLPQMKPERINSFEIGYKSILSNNSISIDWDAYLNVYDGFLGQVEVAVPKTGKVGTDASVLDMLTRNKQDRYRVFTNSINTNKSYGSTFGIKYGFFEKYTIGANVSFNDLINNNKSDIFITAFNTPKWVTNITLGNREIVKNVGFNIVGRWQDSFLWESTLANGDIPAYFTADAQVNVKFPAFYTNLKIGGTNLLNHNYYQYAAGPTIGGLYYLAVTFDLGQEQKKQ
ncbi:TonB-dependent receptor [Flavobacterium humi]|uniref:Energy transducer TonB n=1 Tax=Flavobacterium humi TaxID=2562683 RepID=A0A4Z0LB35_9FLAO|nr:TonB-dependent receptor [Flavobacterium humi]TGD58908.1 energy transducer TonB [Flavobacterium humi]